MAKTSVNQKRDDLKSIDRNEFVDRVAAYPDQHRLNFEPSGEKSKYPIGKIAEQIQANNYEMSDNQYYTLVHYFAAKTVEDVRTVGVTQFHPDPSQFQLGEVSKEGAVSTHDAKFLLHPENNAIQVCVASDAENARDGYVQVGYLPKGYSAKSIITEDVEVDGHVVDYSNGKFKNLSYQMTLDTEELYRSVGGAQVQAEAAAAPETVAQEAVPAGASPDLGMTDTDLSFGGDPVQDTAEAKSEDVSEEVSQAINDALSLTDADLAGIPDMCQESDLNM